MAPLHQHQRLGRRILDAMLRVGAELECCEAWVLTNRSNPAPLGLYAAAGGKSQPRKR